MKIHRFIGTFRLDTDRITVQDPDLVHHMGRVLRLRVGEPVVLCDGKGQEIQGSIESLDKRSVIITVEERRINTVEAKIRLTLYLPLIKRENFELALQKVTEVGVSEIVPLHTSRTVKTKINLERLQTIAREATEQSGRGMVPVVHEPRGFEEVCEELKKEKRKVFFADVPLPSSAAPFVASRQLEPDSFPSSRPQSDGVEGSLPHDRRTASFTSLIREKGSLRVGRDDNAGEGRETVKDRERRYLLIGPEGGWSDEERALARARGFAIVNLGPRILRAETAAIVASYLLLEDSPQ